MNVLKLIKHSKVTSAVAGAKALCAANVKVSPTPSNSTDPDPSS